MRGPLQEHDAGLQRVQDRREIHLAEGAEYGKPQHDVTGECRWHGSP